MSKTESIKPVCELFIEDLGRITGGVFPAPDGGSTSCPTPNKVTTLALGEEGGAPPTISTLATGEEGGTPRITPL